MQIFDENYSLTDTTTFPLVGDPKILGTPVYEGMQKAGVKKENEYGTVKVSTESSSVLPVGSVVQPSLTVDYSRKTYYKNIKFLEDIRGIESQAMFQTLYDFQTKYSAKKNEDGSAFVSWEDAQGNPIRFNSLDEWNKLSSSTRYNLYNSYKKLRQDNHPFINWDDNLAGEGESTLYDFALADNAVNTNALNFKSISNLHGNFMKLAAQKADGSFKEHNDTDRFNYNQALLDENGFPVSKEQYNAIVNNRYNSLISQSTLIRSAVPYNFYRNQLLLEQSSPGYSSDITLKDDDAQRFNEAIINSETVFDLMNNLPKDQLGRFSNKFGEHFTSLQNDNPYVSNCQSPECRELRARSGAEYSRFINDNELQIKTGTDEKTGKFILREPRYDELWKVLKNGKELQTYEKTLNDVITAYDDSKLGGDIVSLRDRYQYLLDAGKANVTKDVPIKYQFNAEANSKDIHCQSEDCMNYQAMLKTVALVFKTFEDGGEALLKENKYKFSFGVKPDNMQNVKKDDEVKILNTDENMLFDLDDTSYQGKYLKQLMSYLPELVIKNKEAKGNLYYREFLTSEDMDNYEIYTLQFHSKFIDQEEFNKPKFTGESDETKIKADILNKFKENGLTIFVPKEIAQQKLPPSIERKNAIFTTPVEAAIADRGMYEINIPRAGNIKVVKDNAANLWRVSGSYLILNESGKYDVTPFSDSLEINYKGSKIPLDIQELVDKRIAYFKNKYNNNTKRISSLNENGVSLNNDTYIYDGR